MADFGLNTTRLLISSRIFRTTVLPRAHRIYRAQYVPYLVPEVAGPTVSVTATPSCLFTGLCWPSRPSFIYEHPLQTEATDLNDWLRVWGVDTFLKHQLASELATHTVASDKGQSRCEHMKMTVMALSDSYYGLRTLTSNGSSELANAGIQLSVISLSSVWLAILALGVYHSQVLSARPIRG